MDQAHYAALRENIERFYREISERYCRGEVTVLDVAPEAHAGIRPHLPARALLETLDIDPASDATHIVDLCAPAAPIPAERFNVVVCTEVLEHTLNPFAAVATLHRMLKSGGRLCLSTPFNFRIHGPLPDCWRFTEHGLRALLSAFDVEMIVPLETPDRPLMPIQYTAVARKR
ncbi:class I SAM-dependent methyltransferase [Methylorubrum populi]